MATTTSTPSDDARNHDYDHSDTASPNQKPNQHRNSVSTNASNGNNNNNRRHSAHEREKLNRNTLNQRASRARRKDYVNSLESKVREYEAQGVQATEEVQNAARRVAEENRVLKEEMRMLREHVRCLEEVLGRRGSAAKGAAGTGLVGGDEDGRPVATDMDLDAARQVELDSAWKRLQHEDRMRRREQFGMQQQHHHHHQQEQPRWHDQRNPSHASLVNLEELPGDAAAVQYPSPPGDGDANGQGQRRQHQHQHHGPNMTVHHPVRPVDQAEFSQASLSAFHAYHDADTDEDIEQHNNLHDRETSNPIYSPYSDVWAQQGYTTSATQAQDPIRQQHSRSQHNLQSSSSSARSMLPANTTPCEEAALIIASMRGMADSSSSYQADILPELGCDSTNRSRPCTVDNARLFRIMDSERV